MNKRERTSPIGIEIGNENEIGIGIENEINNKEFNNIKEAKASTSETSSDAAAEPQAQAKNEESQAKKQDKIDFEKVRQQFNRLMQDKAIPKLKGKSQDSERHSLRHEFENTALRLHTE